MQLQAFAKINLDLRVLGRREDGYHEVHTILQTIDWADRIEIERADHFDFIEHGVDAGEDNLVVKAVRAFERLTGAARTRPSRCLDCIACTARRYDNRRCSRHLAISDRISPSS